RPQETLHRPRALFFARGSTTMREERRPLLLPGDVRSLSRDEQLTFISGSKPIRSRKLRFDREAIFHSRLRPSAGAKLPLTTAHDWLHVAPLGRLVIDKKGATRVQTPAPAGQADLFGHLSNSERASAGLHQPPD